MCTVMHNEEVHNVYTSLNCNDQVSEDKISRACCTHGRGVYIGFGRKIL
jgi:hypothetical protein